MIVIWILCDGFGGSPLLRQPAGLRRHREDLLLPGRTMKWLSYQVPRAAAPRGFPFQRERAEVMVYTMKDVARKAGVSPATVSRVLSKTHYISEETRARVLEVVDALNYHKNVNAQRLATGHNHILAMVISEFANPFYPEVIRGFQSAAWDNGFDVLLLNTEYSRTRADSIIRKLAEKDVSGVAILTSSIEIAAAAPLEEAGICTVFSNLYSAGKLVSNISVNYSRGISQAIEHVVRLGHRRTSVIAGPEESRIAAHIKRALVDGLTQHNLKPSPVISCDYRVDAGASAVHAILAAPEMPTVIFCGSDLIAMGAMSALEEAGVRVPEDVSVVGIDDIAFAGLARPSLTTINVPREELGLTACRALEKMMQLKRHGGAEYTLETELVVRKSTARAPEKRRGKTK
jgi:DNA-binding LacI/PurR family transcriptional regulator